MSHKSARQKGKDLEDYIADQIVEKGLDPKARRDGASGAGNREKGDIITSMMVLGQNAGIEVKNQKTLCIPDWWKQTKKLESLGREPVLAFKIHGEPMEEAKVVIYLDTFLELVKLSQGEKIEVFVEADNRDIKWKGENAVRAVKDFLKQLEK